MDKYAVIKLGGKQLMVTEGYTFEIERQDDVKVEVIAYSDGEKVELGTPVLTDVVVKTKVLAEKRSKKVNVSRFKSKSRYRKNKSHRQPLSVITIESITKGVEKKAAEKKETEKKVVTGQKAKTAEKKTEKKPVKKTTKVKAKEASK